MEQERSYFRALDGLRGLFIMGIVFYHVNGSFYGAFSNELGFFYKYGGYLGNYFFFMLSGFLTAHTSKEGIWTNQISITSFLSKRIKRLYPLYILSIAVQCILMVYQNGLAVLNMKTVLLNILMITSGWVDDFYPFNTPCWFVSMLLLCYIIFYFICYISKKDTNRYPVLLLSMMLWGYVLENMNWSFPFSYVHNGEGFLNFFGGCLLYKIYISITEKRLRRMAQIGILLLSGTIVLSLCFGFEAAAGDVRFVMTLIICPTILICALTQKRLHSLLDAKPFQALGSISTSIYFWHVPLLTLFDILLSQNRIFNIQAKYVGYLFTLLIWSSISHVLIEKGLLFKFVSNIRQKGKA